MSNYETNVQEWMDYFGANPDIQNLTNRVKPIVGGCGWVYEISDPPLVHANEGVAIAIMNSADLSVSEPHYHPRTMTEIYVVIQGMGSVVVGGMEISVEPRTSVVIDRGMAHYTVPAGQLIMAVLNYPPLGEGDYKKFDLTQSNKELGFDAAQYNAFTGHAA